MAPAPSVPGPADVRQRWRLTYSRPAPRLPSDVGREYAAAWEAALLASGLPVARVEGDRPRISFGAPLPTGIAGSAELLELWLTERLAAWRVREAIDAALPVGHRLADLENIWLGAPALPGRISGATYLVTFRSVDRAAMSAAADQVLAAERIPRERQKGGTTKTYDLRPLIEAIEIGPDAQPVVLRLTTRIHPELGSGRPDEILNALGEAAGEPPQVLEIVRERLLLAGD